MMPPSPAWPVPGAAILRLRKGLRLFANLRPVRVDAAMVDASSLRPDRVRDVDLMVVRELTGGLYFSKPKRRYQTPRGESAVDTMRYSSAEIERVAVRAFELARLRRHQVCSVDKANVLETSRLWREVVTRVATGYPDVTCTNMLVDAFAMQLIRAPRVFDVVVTENLFGDILTDEASMLAGSLGMLPSASLGAGTLGLYEPIHGSAPDIAGTGVANPIGAILSGAMLLRWSLGHESGAAMIEAAVSRALGSGLRTADIVSDGTRPVTTANDDRRHRRRARLGRRDSGRSVDRGAPVPVAGIEAADRPEIGCRAGRARLALACRFRSPGRRPR